MLCYNTDVMSDYEQNIKAGANSREVFLLVCRNINEGLYGKRMGMNTQLSSFKLFFYSAYK